MSIWLNIETAPHDREIIGGAFHNDTFFWDKTYWLNWTGRFKYIHAKGCITLTPTVWAEPPVAP